MRAVSVVTAAEASDRFASPLLLLTHLPLDVQSVARILDSLAADGLIDRSDDGVKWVADDNSALGAPAAVDEGEQLQEPGFVQNLVQLRGDLDWCRKVRDQHRVLRAIATLGPTTALAPIAERADLSPPRVRAVLGDFEAEGFIQTNPIDEQLEVTVPDIQYPPERFARNEALLTNIESRAVPVHRAWWVVLAIAAALLVLFIASRLAAV